MEKNTRPRSKDQTGEPKASGSKPDGMKAIGTKAGVPTANYRCLSQEEYVDLTSRILYEDNHLLVVNKKVGEITQGDKTGDECLAETYKAFIARRDGKPGAVFLGIPHRLDRPVSGCVVLAKTSKALERLSAMFRDGDIHKTYRALCCQRPAEDEGLLEDWLVHNEKQNKSYVVKGPQAHTGDTAGGPGKEFERTGTAGRPGKGSTACGAKLARLRYHYLYSTERYHLIEVELLTGRHHQIRCQLAHLGCPIKGDLKYGAPRSNPDGGICLHAWNIRFIHPVKKEPVDITAPLPETWKGVK